MFVVVLNISVARLSSGPENTAFSGQIVNVLPKGDCQEKIAYNSSFRTSYRCVSRNTIGESSTTLHLIVRSQWGVSVEPDLLVADFGSNAEFACKVQSRDERVTQEAGEFIFFHLGLVRLVLAAH